MHMKSAARTPKSRLCVWVFLFGCVWVGANGRNVTSYQLPCLALQFHCETSVCVFVRCFRVRFCVVSFGTWLAFQLDSACATCSQLHSATRHVRHDTRLRTKSDFLHHKLKQFWWRTESSSAGQKQCWRWSWPPKSTWMPQQVVPFWIFYPSICGRKHVAWTDWLCRTNFKLRVSVLRTTWTERKLSSCSIRAENTDIRRLLAFVLAVIAWRVIRILCESMTSRQL